jgi:hypothetical protein
LQEGQTGVIELKAAGGDHPDPADDDPRAVKLMVDYLYIGNYDTGTLPAAKPIPPAENNQGEKGAIEHAGEVTQPGPSAQRSWESATNPTEPTFDTTFDPPQPFNNGDVWGFGVPTKKSKKKKGIIPPFEPSHPENFLEMHAKVFAIASKYDIASLEQAALDKFESQATGNWEVADLIAAVEIVFNHTPERAIELRNALKGAIVRRAYTLVQHPGFEEVVKRIDGLAYDLFCRKTHVQAYTN